MSDERFEGRERAPMPGARSLGKTDRTQRFDVTVLLREGSPFEFARRVAAAERGERDARIGHDEFKQSFGARDEDMTAMSGFATLHGLTVVRADRTRRTVVLNGTVEQFAAAFGVDFEDFACDGMTYRGRIGAVQLPADMQPIVRAVLGLDNRPQAQPHFRVRPSAAGAVSYQPAQVAALYDFPASTGSNQCVGIIELGGGYAPSDLQTYFTKLGITTPPVVSAIAVDGGSNAPTGDPNGPDGEVFLDIEVVGALVPAARIAVYFAPNTDAGFVDAVSMAIHDTVNKPSVISISWGGPESTWEASTITAFDEVLQSASALGITICVASGDGGSSDGLTDGQNHVDFPASSPHVLACGGTSLRGSGTTIASETVWNDGTSGGASGGGVSNVFAVPTWQSGLFATSGTTHVALAMRGVPDVAGDADPSTGYNVLVDGSASVIGGTSAVAPLWAALIARCNARTGTTAGFVNPQFYANPAVFRDITSGDNGAYSAGIGWDACTGLGTPLGSAIAAGLKSS